MKYPFPMNIIISIFFFSENNTKLWTMHRSVRFNQDNQREREEKIIKCIINKLNRSKTDSEFDIFLANNGYDPYHSSDGKFST